MNFYFKFIFRFLNLSLQLTLKKFTVAYRNALARRNINLRKKIDIPDRLPLHQAETKEK